MSSSESLTDYVLHRREEVDIEYKGPMKWTDRQAKLKIIRAMLAMSNNPDGGVVVIGIEEDNNKNFTLAGLKDDEIKTYNYDDVGSVVKEYSDPVIDFNLSKESVEVEREERNFVIIQVKESLDPVLCRKSESWDKSSDWIYENIALRENCIYVRSKAPIGSREMNSAKEWRDFIERKVNQNARSLSKKFGLFLSEHEEKGEEGEISKHDNDLKKDNL